MFQKVENKQLQPKSNKKLSKNKVLKSVLITDTLKQISQTCIGRLTSFENVWTYTTCNACKNWIVTYTGQNDVRSLNVTYSTRKLDLYQRI